MFSQETFHPGGDRSRQDTQLIRQKECLTGDTAVDSLSGNIDSNDDAKIGVCQAHSIKLYPLMVHLSENTCNGKRVKSCKLLLRDSFILNQQAVPPRRFNTSQRVAVW